MTRNARRDDTTRETRKKRRETRDERRDDKMTRWQETRDEMTRHARREKRDEKRETRDERREDTTRDDERKRWREDEMIRRRENRHAKLDTRYAIRETRDARREDTTRDDEMTTFHELLVLYRDQCNFVIMSLPLLQSLLHEWCSWSRRSNGCPEHLNIHQYNDMSEKSPTVCAPLYHNKLGAYLLFESR